MNPSGCELATKRPPGAKALSYAFDAAPKLGWRPGLDGLRGVAVLLVMLYHFKTKPWFLGGSIGVDLFFVLSGFLITTLLLQEWHATGSISLKNFYIRRALRLMPAVIAFCCVYFVIMLAFEQHSFTSHQDPERLLKGLGFASLYVLNWAMALGFDEARGFGHLWSLSIEEQFYVLWPAILLLMKRAGLHTRVMIGVTIGLIVLSASVPFVLSSVNWRRVYFGSDFRAHGLLIGTLAGQLYVASIFRPSLGTAPWFKAAAGLAALGVAVFVLEGNNKDAYLYTSGGYPLLSLACCVLVLYSAFAQRGPMAAILQSRPLVYLGQRSYAVYLWHVPIALWLPGLDVLPDVVLGIGLSVCAAELSYRLVERPALQLKDRFAAGTPARSSKAARKGREATTRSVEDAA